MNLKELISLSLLATSIGCSNPPRILEEKPIAEQVKNKSYKYVIKAIKTPEEAEKYLTEFLTYVSDSINYKKFDYIASFKKINQKGRDDCDGGAIAAASSLKDDGYPPLYLRMYMHHPLFGPLLVHAVYPYQENKNSCLWGSLGISEVDCKKPNFTSIKDLVKSFGFYLYDLVNLDELYSNWTEKSIGDGTKIRSRELKQVYVEED
mgnify:FL=1